MTKPHTTLSEAVRALELPTPSWARDHHGENEVYIAQDLRNIREAAAKLVEQHEAQEPVAWRYRAKLGCGDWSEWRPATKLIADTCTDPAMHEVQPLYAQPTLAATQAGDAWQLIETAPKDTAMLLYCGSYYELGHFNTAIGRWVDLETHRALRTPTHWMLLPPAPTTTRSE